MFRTVRVTHHARAQSPFTLSPLVGSDQLFVLFSRRTISLTLRLKT